MTDTQTTHRLADVHRRFLLDHAIDPRDYPEGDLYTADRPDSLPPRIDCPTPALVFALHRVSGGVVWQARPDRPRKDAKGREMKYVQQRGEGGILFAPEDQPTDWRDARTIMLVEGTKQTMAASRHLPDGVAAVGLLGCWNWSSEGFPGNDLHHLLRHSKATRFVVAFDADVSSNPNVNRSASMLLSSLRELYPVLRGNGGTPTVLFATLQNRLGTKADIDGEMGRLTDGERDRLMRNMLKDAGDLPACVPLENNLPVVMRYDLGLALLRDDEGSDGLAPGERPTVLPDNALMGCTVRVTNAIRWKANPKDPDAPLGEPLFDVEAAIFNPGGRPTVVPMRNLTLKQVEDLGSLVRSLPDDRATSIRVPRDPRTVRLVLDSLWESSTGSRETYRVAHIGWDIPADGGRASFTLPQGSMTADGWVQGDAACVTKSDLGGEMRKIRMEPLAVNDDVRRAASMLTLGLRGVWAKPVRSDASLGALALSFLPTPPACVVAYFGGFSNGKSTLMQTYNALVGSAWGPTRNQSMLAFSSTSNAIDLAMRGIDNFPVFVDDMKMPASRVERVKLNEIFDSIVRRAHGSGERMRGQVQNGSVGLRRRDDSQPLPFIVGERIPDDAAASALSRIYQVPMDTPQSLSSAKQLKEATGADEGLRDVIGSFMAAYLPCDELDEGGNKLLTGIQRMTSAREWQQVIPLYLRWLARRIESEKADGGDFSARIADRRNMWAEYVNDSAAWKAGRSRGLRLSTRESLVVAGILTGLQYWTEFMDETGLWLSDAAKESWHAKLDQGHGEPAVAGIIANHLKAADSLANDTGSLLDRLRSYVMTGRVTLGNEMGQPVNGADDGNKPIIGYVKAFPDEGNAYCFAPDTLIRELRLEQTVCDVKNAMAQYTMHDQKDSPVRQIRIAGRRLRMLCIPEAVWFGEDGDEPGNGPEPKPTDDGPKGASPMDAKPDTERPVEAPKPVEAVTPVEPGWDPEPVGAPSAKKPTTVVTPDDPWKAGRGNATGYTAPPADDSRDLARAERDFAGQLGFATVVPYDDPEEDDIFTTNESEARA